MWKAKDTEQVSTGKVVEETKKSGHSTLSKLDQHPSNHTRIIVWLRNDLRIRDNNALNWAINYKGQNSSSTKEIIPVFCFDPRNYKKDQSQTDYQTRKTGILRSQFQIESILDLRKSLIEIGSNLLVSLKKPENFIQELISPDCNNYVVFQKEICSEELMVEANVANKLKKLGTKTSIKIESVWGSTLLHIDDLPINAKEVAPGTFTQFR